MIELEHIHERTTRAALAELHCMPVFWNCHLAPKHDSKVRAFVIDVIVEIVVKGDRLAALLILLSRTVFGRSELLLSVLYVFGPHFSRRVNVAKLG